MSPSVAVISEGLGAPQPAPPPEVVPFSSWSGVTSPSLDADQSGRFRPYRVIVVNTRATSP